MTAQEKETQDRKVGTFSRREWLIGAGVLTFIGAQGACEDAADRRAIETNNTAAEIVARFNADHKNAYDLLDRIEAAITLPRNPALYTNNRDVILGQIEKLLKQDLSKMKMALPTWEFDSTIKNPDAILSSIKSRNTTTTDRIPEYRELIGDHALVLIASAVAKHKARFSEPDAMYETAQRIEDMLKTKIREITCAKDETDRRTYRTDGVVSEKWRNQVCAPTGDQIAR